MSEIKLKYPGFTPVLLWLIFITSLQTPRIGQAKVPGDLIFNSLAGAERVLKQEN